VFLNKSLSQINFEFRFSSCIYLIILITDIRFYCPAVRFVSAINEHQSQRGIRIRINRKDRIYKIRVPQVGVHLSTLDYLLH